MALTCCCRARGQAAGAAPAGEPGRDFGDGATAPSFPRNIPVPAPGTQSAHPAPSQRGSRSRRARAPGMSEESARGAPRGEDLRWWERANGPPRGSLSFPGRSADARTLGKAFCCPGQLRTSPGGGCRSRPCSRCFRNEREEEVKLFFCVPSLHGSGKPLLVFTFIEPILPGSAPALDSPDPHLPTPLDAAPRNSSCKHLTSFKRCSSTALPPGTAHLVQW